MANSGFSVAGLFGEHVESRPATCPGISASRKLTSSTSPPRAQLMMRTPFFIFAKADASTMFLVFSVSGVCSVMKSARFEQLVELDLVHADVGGALGREERIVGDHAHAQAERAIDHDRADIASADHASVLPVISTPMKRFFSHLPAGSTRRPAGSGAPARASA